MFIARFLGRMLYSVRGHDSGLAINDPALSQAPNTIIITSTDFTAGQPLPLKCAGEGIGENQSPQLSWSNLPEGTQEVVMYLQDPDAPVWFVAMHTIVLSISPTVTSFDTGVLTLKGPPTSEPHAEGWRFAKALLGKRGYLGPGPVPAHGPHRYFFEFFALKEKLPEEAANWTEKEITAAMGPLVLARGDLVGTYERE